MAQSPGKAKLTAKPAASPTSPASGKASSTPKTRAKPKAAQGADKPAAKPQAKGKAPARKAAAPEDKAKAVRRPTQAKEAAASQKPAAPVGVVTPEQRYRMICDAAYFRAERRGFVGGSALEDWLAAEAEIDALLREMQAREAGQ
jgi:hypothetical protein